MTEAVSSVLGTVLMLAVTVSVFGGLAIFVFSQVEEGAAVRPSLRALSEEDALILQHKGGPSLPLEDVTLVVQVDDLRAERPMTDFVGTLGDAWDPGESLCVSCLYPAQDVQGARILAYNELLLEVGVSFSAGGGSAPASGTSTYPDAGSAAIGTLADFDAARALDDAAAASLQEAESGTTPFVYTLHADTVAASTDWTTPENGFSSDGLYATTTSTAASARYDLTDATGSGPVTSVVVRAVVQIPSWRNDGWTLSLCLPSGCTNASARLGDAAGPQSIAYDVTSLRPGGGAWSWTDLASAEAVVAPSVVSGGGPQVDSSWELDRIYVEAAEEVPALRLESEWTFPNLPPGIARLEVRARAEDETFTVQLWNGTAWNDVLSVDTLLFELDSHLITSAQRNGGLPRLRFVDDDPAGAAIGRLEVDYVRVVTT